MPSLAVSGKLSEGGLNAITWAGVGLAAIFLAGRTAIRIRKVQRLRADDYIIYVAFLILVINAILQTLQTPDVYYIARVHGGSENISEASQVEELVERGSRYTKFEFTIIGLFWTVLWLVKASFLAFFYNLFEGLRLYRILWWIVCVFSFLAYSGCWIASVMTCHPATDYFKFGMLTPLNS